jgi:hypothetical protein
MTHSIEELLAEVATKWSKSGIQTEPPASPAELHAFESRFRVQCPYDFSIYVNTLGGMKDGEWDEHLIRFWPLREIRPADDTPAHVGLFVFADYSISVHEYAIQLANSDHGKVVALSGASPRMVASTFSEFIAFYLADTTALF